MDKGALERIENFFKTPACIPIFFSMGASIFSILTFLKNESTLEVLSELSQFGLTSRNELDAIAYAQTISRLDFAALCLAILGVGLTLAVIPTFLHIKSAAIDAARQAATDALNNQLPKLIEEAERTHRGPRGSQNDRSILISDTEVLQEERDDGAS